MIHSGLLICSFFVKERYGRDDSKVINLNNEIHIEQVGNCFRIFLIIILI